MVRFEALVDALPDGLAVFKHVKRLQWKLIGAIAALAVTSTANAGIIITMSEGGLVGPTVVVNTASDAGSFSGAFGDYTVSINTAVTNSPGAGSFATLNVSSTEIRGVAAAGSTGVLSINVVASPFTIPAATTPVFFLQSIGSNSSSSLATVTFQSFLDGAPAPLQGPLAHGESNTIVAPFPGPLSTFPFNISDTTTILVSPGLEGSTSGSTIVSNTPNFFPPPVPEPGSTLVWVVTAATVFGVAKLRKRWASA